MEEQAQKLAQALLDNKQNSFVVNFSVTNTEEVIVVIAEKLEKGQGRKLKENFEKRFNPSASGTVCGCCGGTGRQ